MILDEATFNHLVNWCCGQSHEPYDLATIMTKWLETLSEDDHGHALQMGWPWVRDQAFRAL